MYIRNFNYLNCRNGMPVPSTIKSQENNNSMNQSVVLECLVPALAGNKRGCGSPSWYVTAKSHRFYFPLNTKRALRSLASQRPTTHKPNRRRVCRTKFYHNPQLQSINELSFWILRHRLQRRHWFCARWNRQRHMRWRRWCRDVTLTCSGMDWTINDEYSIYKCRLGL